MEPYGLSPDFELLVLRLCATDASFYRRVGAHVEPERLAHPQAKMILGAIRLHMAESGGVHPGSAVVVVQRVSRLAAEGKVKQLAVLAVSETFDAAVDVGRADPEAIIAELVPVVRRRMHSSAVVAAHDAYSKRGDFQDVTELIETARKLGTDEVGVALGVDLEPAAVSIFGDSGLPRLRTGILELDVALDGGLPQGSLGTVLAESGGGKSQFLISQAAEAVRLGMSVMVATLELPPRVQLARLMANLTGVPVTDILRDPKALQRAFSLLEKTQQSRGPCRIDEFEPRITTVEELAIWVSKREQKTGRKVDVVVADYGDKLWARAAKEGNDYMAMLYVWEGLRRGIAVAGERWVWTASQAKAREEKQRKNKLDMADTADSQHKVRVSDLFISLNPLQSDNFEEFDIFVAKNRGERGRYTVGPIFADFSRGRITCTTLP